MNIDPKELAKKIVSHINNDIRAMVDMGEIQIDKRQQVYDTMLNIWPNAIENMIKKEINPVAEKHQAFFDGGAKPNPGERTIGGYAEEATGFRILEYSRKIGFGTNNEAEYFSLIYLLDRLIEEDIQDVDIYGDSELVVNQVNGKFQANGRMMELRDMVLKRLQKIGKWTLNHVLRDENKDADKLT